MRQGPDIVHNSLVPLALTGFLRAHAEGNALRPTPDRTAILKQLPVGNEERWAFQQKFPKDSWTGDDSVKRDERTERRSPQPCIFSAPSNPIGALDEGHDFVNEKIRIALAQRLGYGRKERLVRQKLADTLDGCVIDADDDHGRHHRIVNQLSQALAHVPIDAGKSRRGIKQILPVVEIQNRITAPFVFY